MNGIPDILDDQTPPEKTDLKIIQSVQSLGTITRAAAILPGGEAAVSLEINFKKHNFQVVVYQDGSKVLYMHNGAATMEDYNFAALDLLAWLLTAEE